MFKVPWCHRLWPGLVLRSTYHLLTLLSCITFGASVCSSGECGKGRIYCTDLLGGLRELMHVKSENSAECGHVRAVCCGYFFYYFRKPAPILLKKQHDSMERSLGQGAGDPQPQRVLCLMFWWSVSMFPSLQDPTLSICELGVMMPTLCVDFFQFLGR